MLLTLSTTHSPASDLGYLLHKNPAKVQRFSLGFGEAIVFYTEASEQKCTAVLALDIDSVGLVRKKYRPSGQNYGLDHYVNDRPYVASSFLSVAIGDIYRSALNGRSADRPELVNTPIPLEASLPVLPCRGGEALARMLFEPLGYELQMTQHLLDEEHPEWGKSTYYALTLKATKPLKELLSHLYVLIPVMDNDKHYWIGKEEVEKLLRHGANWLSNHPHKELISKRYLKHQNYLMKEALSRLSEDNDDISASEVPFHRTKQEAEQTIETSLSLNARRIKCVCDLLNERNISSVLDLGCGEGKLLASLIKEKHIKKVTGVDVSMRSLEIAQERLHLDRLPDAMRDKLTLLQGSLTYRDKRWNGFDAATLIEVIEHIELSRLPAVERAVFQYASPQYVIITTPNAEYNILFPQLPTGKLRHSDHRFEWTRLEFQSWAQAITEAYSYDVIFTGIGEADQNLGSPTQLALFTRKI